MRPLQAQTVLRVAGVVAWVLVGAQTLARVPPVRPAAVPVAAMWIGNAVVLAFFLAFGIAFWINTARVQPARPSRRSVLLLVLQAVLGCMVHTDLMMIVAAEVPFVFTGRAAARWMAGQVLVMVFVGLGLAAIGHFEAAEGLAHLDRPVTVVLTMGSVLSWQVFAFAGGYLATNATRARDELARVNAELRATQSLLADSSRAAERLHIARELHDTLGHHLAALSVNLELAARRAGGEAAEPVREAHRVTRLLLADVRDVVSAIREDRVVDLRGALETLVSGSVDPQIHLSLPADLAVADSGQAHAVFRCVQEAVTNAIRHAAARNIWIEVGSGRDGLEVGVRDDGRGTLSIVPGHGLTGMRERFEDMGGRLVLQSEDGRGFAVRGWLPHAGGAS